MRRLAPAVLLLLLWAAPADAATYCVGASAPGCVDQPSLSAALAAAADEPGVDTIRVGRRTETGAVADATGEPVHVVGAGRGATTLDGRVDLNEDRSSLTGVTVRATGTALALRGAGRRLRVEGAVRLRDGALLHSSAVAGAVVTAGQVQVHSVAVAGPGVDVESGTLAANHLTVFGSGAVGLRMAGSSQATVANSILWGFARGTSGRAAVTFSALPEGGVDPRFVDAPGDLRLRPDSPLVEAGDPRPLAAAEPETDAGGDVRAMDGDGDGTARRDAGAYERRPAAPPPAQGNLLANPGAEQGALAENDTAAPAPPRWRRTGGFTSVRYGTVVGEIAFPSLEAAATLAAGDGFFAAGPSGPASATQTIDVSGWAPEIDGRSGVSVLLSALLGGFRESPDHATVTASFLGPSGIRLGRVSLAPVTVAERANATMLMPRSASAAVPRLTRAVRVRLAAGAPGGRYNDGYVDDVALVPTVPPLAGVPPRRGRGGRPFGGVVVLSRRVRVARGRARVRVGCADRTVRRCAGTVTLTRRRTVILGTRRVAMRPGESQRVRIPLSLRERRQLRRPQRGHVYAAVRDARGRTRALTAPVRIVRR
ncbi:MAG TPA: hypothetical protein VNO82_02255 [Solirubrobacteraceae bacterium]|nr:hypothetical protein [Solirubrobacteraceae bacterium]